MRTTSFLILLALGSRAAADDNVAPGTRVRLTAGSQTIIGEVAETHDGTVVVVRDGRRIDISARSISELEISEGPQPQTVKWGFLGFFIGIGVGAAVTLALGPGGDENDYFLEYTLLPPMVAGAVIGAVAGSFVKRGLARRRVQAHPGGAAGSHGRRGRADVELLTHSTSTPTSRSSRISSTSIGPP